MGRELPTNLVRRGSKVWVRIEVPKDLRDVIGKAVVFESTGHDDDRKGRDAGIKRLAELRGQWAALRAKAEAVETLRDMTPVDRQRAARDFFDRELANDEARRLDLPDAEQLASLRQAATTPTPELAAAIEANPAYAQLATLFHGIDFLAARDEAAFDQKRRAALLRELKRHLGTGETALVSDMAAQVIRRDRLPLKRGSTNWKALCRDLTRAWIAALEVQEARDVGDYTAKPRDPLLTVALVEAPEAKPGESIMEMWTQFESLNPSGSTADTLRYSRPIVQGFAESMPLNSPASAINKRTVVRWLDLLAELPVKAAQTRHFAGMTLPEIIEANRRLPEPKPPIEQKTVNKYLSALSSFCKWLSARDVIPANPTTNLFVRVDREQTRRPYTLDELRRIFGSPLYRGFAADGKEHLPGIMHANDWRHWLPLLGLFTGARLGELAQLLTADVRRESGEWVIYVVTAGDAQKSVKTHSARRVIPVHPELIALGFLRHHAEMLAKGERRLFPELTPGTRNQISGTPSRWWGRLMGRIGVKVDRTTVFHSFRHGLADELRRAGYLDHEFGFVLGHADGRTAITRGYGMLPHGTLARRVEILSKVRFDGLDLSHLAHSNCIVNTTL